MASQHSWDAYASAPRRGGPSQERGAGIEGPPAVPRYEAVQPPPYFVQQDVPAADAALHPPRIQSCQFCRRRKIRCDKTMPSCVNCVKAKSVCVYPKRKGRVKAAAARKAEEELSGREEMLWRRVKELEAMVEQLQGGKAEGEEHFELDHEGKDLRVVVGEALNQICDPLGKLTVGQPYLKNEFWAGKELKEILDDSSDEMDSEYEDFPLSDTSARGVDFIFGVSPIYEDLSMFHPPITQIFHYWYVYLEDCECLLRLLHIPSFTPVIQEAVRNNLRDLSKSDELLMFCIYFAAITSLTDKEVERQFGEPRDVLLARYDLAIKHGLTRAKFLHTQDFKVLQALVLYLSCIPNVDSVVAAVYWNMLGLALRIAQSMSVDRDGEILKLSPLETELRRRLWYHLLYLDVRGAEGRGGLSTVLQYDTRLPTNVNESDLTPDMTEYAKGRHELTDMTVPLMRFEAARLGRRLQATGFRDTMLSPPMKSKLIERVQQALKENYIKYCMGAGAVYEYSSKVVMMITTRANLALYADKVASTTKTDKDWLFRIGMEILEFYHELDNSSNLNHKWSWLIKIHVQWQAVAFILKELIERSPSEDTERAWRIIDKSAPAWQQPQDEKGTLVYESVKKLLAKAQKKRDRLAPRSADNSTSPDSIDWNIYTTTNSNTIPRASKKSDNNATSTNPISGVSQSQIAQHSLSQPQPLPQPQGQVQVPARLPRVEQVPYDYYFDITESAHTTAFQTGAAVLPLDAPFPTGGVDPSFQDPYLASFDAPMPLLATAAAAGSAALPPWYYPPLLHDAGPGPGVAGGLLPGEAAPMAAQAPLHDYHDYAMGMGPGIATALGSGGGGGGGMGVVAGTAAAAPGPGGQRNVNRTREGNKGR